MLSHLTTPPHTLKHNRFFEKCHHHIVEATFTFLHHASISITYWPYAFETIVYLINCKSKVNFSMFFTFETLFRHPHNISKHWVFGCLCYPWFQPYISHKLEPKFVPCIFLGHSLSQSAYCCFDPKEKKNLHFSSCHIFQGCFLM